MRTRTKRKGFKKKNGSVSEFCENECVADCPGFLELITFMIDAPVQTAADRKSRPETKAKHKHNFLFTINIEMGEIYYGTEKS